MAAKALLRGRAIAPMTATLAVVGFVVYPRTIHAEAPEGLPMRKPIYDDPSLDSLAGSTLPGSPASTTQSNSSSSTSLSSIFSAASPPSSNQAQQLRGPTPTDRLAAQIGTARLFLYRQASAAESAVDHALDRAFYAEQTVADTVASLAPPRESGERLLPGVLYVLVAAMAGSIATRRRNIVLRAAVPLAFGVGAASVLLPLTTRNVGALLWRLEEKVPVVADAHRRTQEGIAKGVHFARVHGEVGVRYVDEKVGQAREALEGWVRKGN